MKGILKDPDLAATVSQDIPGMLNGLKADIVDGLNKVGFDKQASKISNIDVSKFVSLDDFTKQVSPLLKEASFNPTTVAGESILKSGTKLASEVEKLRLEKEANIRAFGSETRPNVPEAGQPPLGYINPQAFKQLPAPRGNVIELPSSGILDSQSKLRTLVPEVQEIIKTPLIKEAESFASKNDYVTYKNTETWQNTKDAIELKKQKKTFGDVWEEAHPSPESLRAPKEQKSIKLRSVKEWSTVSKTTSPIEQAPVSPKTEARSGTIYHGTKAPISSLKEADVLQYGKPNALYGQGLYVTDNPRVAEGYSITKGKGGPGKILEGSILPDVNLLNLDESLSPDVLKQLNHWTNFGNESGNPIVINGKNGQEAMKQFMNSLDGLPTSEAQDIMEGLQTSLEEMGYDGFKHTGGQITGGIPSNVSILWDGGKRKAVDKIDVAIPKTEVPTQPVVDRQPIKSALPTVKDELTNRTIERLNQEIPVDVTDDIRQYQKTTNAKQVEEIMTHNFAFQKDVALGRKQPPVGGAPATAYRAHLENLADEFANKGDTSLAEELSKTKVIDSEAGASLQATQIASKDSLTAILSDVRNQMVKKIPRGDIQLSKLTDDLKIKIAATKQAKPTRQILKVILDNIKC